MEFRRYFSSALPPLERTSSVQQVLLMLNGQFVQGGSQETARVIRGLLDVPGLSRRDRIDAVYLMTLSRLPSDAERQRISDHVKSSENARQGLSDALWALVNSAEFVVNH